MSKAQKGKKLSEETKKKIGESHKGERNYHWMGGLKEYRERRKNNPRYILNNRISRGISHCLKGNKNGRHWEKLVGYTHKQLIKHLKETLPVGYDWQDFLSGKLHIDHKIPISAHNFTKPEHIDFKRCWALVNLQLLPALKNRIKHDKLTEDFQPSFKI